MPQREPVTGRSKLYLLITVVNAQGEDVEAFYRVKYLAPHPEVANPAWRLTRKGGMFYDVHVTRHGPQCTCADFIWCREHRDKKGCKHIAALKAEGLLQVGNIPHLTQGDQ